MTNQIPEVGTELPNGAILLLASSHHIIAKFRGEFVSWAYTLVNDKIDCFWGHYFNNMNSALTDFNAREF